MIIAIAAILTIGVVLFTIGVRAKDLPPEELESPFKHLDELKARIYENLRDLQFEFRVGKLSDEDYKSAKLGLQRELAGVMAEVDKLKTALGVTIAPKKAAAKTVKKTNTCPHCSAVFDKAMKFCGECGKPW
jgi:NifB/MoaA-like Fe-S oxidoreductase